MADSCAAESAKVMATPTGLRQASRDLGFPPEGQGQPQEGMPSLPPGFSYTQLESMVRELRTAAALEVCICGSTYSSATPSQQILPMWLSHYYHSCACVSAWQAIALLGTSRLQYQYVVKVSGAPL